MSQEPILTSAKIHGGADGVSWAAEGLENALDETASLPVAPADWLDGLPMLSTPWANALGQKTGPEERQVRGWFKRHPDKRRGRHRR